MVSEHVRRRAYTIRVCCSKTACNRCTPRVLGIQTVSSSRVLVYVYKNNDTNCRHTERTSLDGSLYWRITCLLFTITIRYITLRRCPYRSGKFFWGFLFSFPRISCALYLYNISIRCYWLRTTCGHRRFYFFLIPYPIDRPTRRIGL